jgi:hypothetical protein
MIYIPWTIIGLSLLLIAVTFWRLLRIINRIRFAAEKPIPIYAEFGREMLPLLIALWGIVLGFLTINSSRFTPLIVIAIYLTVAILMLNPVGRHFGLHYLEYRRPLFILGVLSMAYIPIIGFIMTSSLPFLVKSIFWFFLPIDLTIFAFLPSLKQGIGKPMRQIFRPDLLFGDGRMLCCGLIALLFGVRYIIGPPPANLPWALPRWDWWAIAFAMIFGFIPLIPIRGMMKLFMRLARLFENKFYGWWGIFVKEFFFVFTALSIITGFHHVFKGWYPFNPQFFEEVKEAIAEPNRLVIGLSLFIFGFVWLVFVRGYYKKKIGEPFIVETTKQTYIKELLFIIGFLPLFYGYMSLIEHHFGILNKPSMLAIGIPFFIWGLIMLLPLRVIAQKNQRRAIVEQMATIILPAEPPEKRREVMTKIMNGLANCPESVRFFMMRTMREALEKHADEETRKIMTATQMECLAGLPDDWRKTLMKTMDKILLQRSST